MEGCYEWTVAWAQSYVGLGERVCLCVSTGSSPATVGSGAIDEATLKMDGGALMKLLLGVMMLPAVMTEDL